MWRLVDAARLLALFLYIRMMGKWVAAPLLNPPKVAPELSSSLSLIGSRLEVGRAPGSELARALELIGELPLENIEQADRAIAFYARLYQQAPKIGVISWLRGRRNARHQLVREANLAYLFLFHRNGHLREAALRALVGGISSPFFFAVVAWRLNDWVPEVRQAAVDCAGRCFPKSDPEVVARCAAVLLIRRLAWERWSVEDRVLDEAFARPDVAACLADLIVQSTTGPLPTLLRAALRIPALDLHLSRIAFSAVQPVVRATALRILIDGVAEWPSRYGWEWIDKSMGLRVRKVVYDRRDLAAPMDRHKIIERGISDRSAIVRRVAITGVVQHLRGTKQGLSYAQQLLEDSSPSVRECAQFIMRDTPDHPEG